MRNSGCRESKTSHSKKHMKLWGYSIVGKMQNHVKWSWKKSYKLIILLGFACFLPFFMRNGIDLDGKSKLNRFHLDISDPIVVGQQEYLAEEKGWGYFQFPRLCYTTDGCLLMQIANKKDSIETYSGAYLYYISNDKGETWQECSSENLFPDLTLQMDNGRYFQGPLLQDATIIEGLQREIPYYSSENETIRLFGANKETLISESFLAVEYDQSTSRQEVFEAHYQWEKRSLSEINGLLLPNGVWFYPYKMHSPYSILREDNGNLFAIVYGYGEVESSLKDLDMYNIFFLRSNDNGRTWNYVSGISSEDICGANSEGLCEPSLTVAPDGRYYILMRSGSEMPSYYSYSLNKGKTWSIPDIFDNIGVAPQLITLDIGVTLASYGRPGVYIRATDDPACLLWQEPYEIELSQEISDNVFSNSCGYTSMIKINKDTVLLAYSDFHYPSIVDPDTDAKTILVRKIHVNYSY